MTIALWGHTLDQHHTGLRQVEVDDNTSMGDTLDQHHTGLRQAEMDDNASMGGHTGPTPYWVEAG